MMKIMVISVNAEVSRRSCIPGTVLIGIHNYSWQSKASKLLDLSKEIQTSYYSVLYHVHTPPLNPCFQCWVLAPDPARSRLE